MVAPLQKKWFRVEQSADGSILSCTEVDAKGRKGAHVRFYEAADSAAACDAAKAWYENYAAKDRAAQRTRYGKRKSEGSCTRCKSPPVAGKSLCARHRDALAEYNRAHYLGQVSPHTPLDPAIARARILANVKKQGLLQRPLKMNLRAVLREFDARNPVDFRVWLVLEIEKRRIRGLQKLNAKHAAGDTPLAEAAE